jgi:Ca2+-transporting ATPase
LLRAYTARSEKISLFKMNPFTNKYLNQCVAVSVVFLLCAVYMPGFREVFSNVPLTSFELLCAAGFALFPLIGGEISKVVARRAFAI